MNNQGYSSEVQNQYPLQPVEQPYPKGQEYGQSQQGYGQQNEWYGQQPQQPGFVYPNAPPYSTTFQPNGLPVQNQQPQVVIVGGQPTPVYVTQTPLVVSMVGATVLSCFVLWFCGIVFGLIAFILAMVGHNSASRGDILGAIRLRNASYGVSIAGFVLGIIIIGVVTGIYRATAATTYYYYY